MIKTSFTKVDCILKKRILLSPDEMCFQRKYYKNPLSFTFKKLVKNDNN